MTDIMNTTPMVVESTPIPPKDEEEIMLEKLVFGDLDDFEMNLRQTENFFSDSEDVSEQESEDDFFIDEGNDEVEGVEFVSDAGSDMEVDSGDESGEDSAEDAWNDSEDENIQISLTSSAKLKKLRHKETDDYINGKAYVQRLRSQYEKIYPRPQWADLTTASSEDSDIESDTEPSNNSGANLLNLINTTTKFTTTQLKLISPNKLAISRLKDANITKRAKSGIQTLSFHKSSPLLITGGFDKTIRVYHIDGKLNTMVTSLFVKNCPIYSAGFTDDLIYIGGRRKFLNKWDLANDSIEKISRMYGFEKFQKSMEYFKISAKGSYVGLLGSGGYCNILNGKTGVFITNYKIEGVIVDFEFSSDESELIIINSHGEVWEFPLGDGLSNKQPIRRWNDESGIGITKLSLRGKWLAVGTNNGIVNLYDRSKFEVDKPVPFKVVDNLVTTISTLEFSPDGQLLVIASRGKRDALRIVQLPTGSVYSNWPTSGTPLGKVLCVAFTPNNQMLAIGNDQGKVSLWRLNHY